MNKVFEPIEVEWNGAIKIVPPNRIMGMICQIEDVVTLTELQSYAVRQTAPLAKLSAAQGKVLRYAGFDVTDEQVYAHNFTGEHVQENMIRGLVDMLRMMLPSDALAKFDAEMNDGDPPKGNQKAAGARSSKRRSNSAAGRRKTAARV